MVALSNDLDGLDLAGKFNDDVDAACSPLESAQELAASFGRRASADLRAQPGVFAAQKQAEGGAASAPFAPGTVAGTAGSVPAPRLSTVPVYDSAAADAGSELLGCAEGLFALAPRLSTVPVYGSDDSATRVRSELVGRAHGLFALPRAKGVASYDAAVENDGSLWTPRAK